ncbi:hypothetical protein [Nonomuraea sp. NPDC002799]
MTYPKLPTCAPWCTSEHTTEGEYCGHSIESIFGPAAPDDIDVDVVRADGREFVRVQIDDRALTRRHEDGELGHYEVHLSAYDAGVLGDTLRRLDFRGAHMFGAALFSGMELIRQYACRWEWCIAEHRRLGVSPDHHHSATLTVANVEVTRHLTVRAGNDPDLAFLRVRYLVGDQWRIWDRNPDQLLDHAHLFEAIEVGEIDELIAAFRAAAADLGVTE